MKCPHCKNDTATELLTSVVCDTEGCRLYKAPEREDKVHDAAREADAEIQQGIITDSFHKRMDEAIRGLFGCNSTADRAVGVRRN